MRTQPESPPDRTRYMIQRMIYATEQEMRRPTGTVTMTISNAKPRKRKGKR
jgi:hypothetical protein